MTPSKVQYQLSVGTKEGRGEIVGVGVLYVDEKSEATFFKGDGGKNLVLLARMERVRLELATSAGMKLSGFERTGKLDSRGSPTFLHKEWYVMFCEVAK